MSKETFNIKQKAVIVPVAVKVDDHTTRDIDFIVDTGTYETLICENRLRQMGYTRVDSIEDVPIQTVGGNATAYRYIIEDITALGVTRRNFRVISHPMPSGSGAYGLLGLDFFEDKVLTIDFKQAVISVN